MIFGLFKKPKRPDVVKAKAHPARIVASPGTSGLQGAADPYFPWDAESGQRLGRDFRELERANLQAGEDYIAGVQEGLKALAAFGVRNTQQFGHWRDVAKMASDRLASTLADRGVFQETLDSIDRAFDRQRARAQAEQRARAEGVDQAYRDRVGDRERRFERGQRRRDRQLEERLSQRDRQLQTELRDREVWEAPDPRDIADDETYQFRFEEGLRVVNRAQAARGGLGGGAHIEAASRFGRQLTAEEVDLQRQRSIQDYELRQEERGQYLDRRLAQDRIFVEQNLARHGQQSDRALSVYQQYVQQEQAAHLAQQQREADAFAQQQGEAAVLQQQRQGSRVALREQDIQGLTQQAQLGQAGQALYGQGAQWLAGQQALAQENIGSAGGSARIGAANANVLWGQTRRDYEQQVWNRHFAQNQDAFARQQALYSANLQNAAFQAQQRQFNSSLRTGVSQFNAGQQNAANIAYEQAKQQWRSSLLGAAVTIGAAGIGAGWFGGAAAGAGSGAASSFASGVAGGTAAGLFSRPATPSVGGFNVGGGGYNAPSVQGYQPFGVPQYTAGRRT